MAKYFFDTSAIVKYYHEESGTQAVTRIFAEPESAFAMKVRSGVLDPKGAGMRRASLLSDLAMGVIEVYRLTDHHFEIAALLIGRHSFVMRLRTLDALQLAVALALSRENSSPSWFLAQNGKLGNRVPVRDGYRPERRDTRVRSDHVAGTSHSRAVRGLPPEMQNC